MTMKTNNQRLSRYIRDYKYAQHQCCSCGNELSRVRLLLSGILITHKDIMQMDRPVTREEWQIFMSRLEPVCRFCSTVSAGRPAALFDIPKFKQYLLEDNSLCLATVREYVMRLRRLDLALSRQGMAADQLPDLSSQEQWERLLPEKSRINYRIALAKYACYFP
ncbi:MULTISPECIES: flagella biosynthesis regulatory protein FliZ [Tatumella]|uniref:Flagella biosynthesis regulatory protein FliZ n=1 Tax=Tatumella punctata TaxID=399969 RepID=A0ABW1VLP1_9GAMM|nr:MULTISPECIES: flagella biosynthesis regulatory protein FliZ [unclassified Tatumella]MBS0855442.1 flagella biosynthesis regulatory protein FliZ [Tatumella sp. JGM16]MBS0895007.1 flagella biosynthesis regulatory protein FliZ [Tatumella sp. JGM130]MBS0911676.1 flagella biosynthesis regulatory protein FliZ [Tatumella sp. JGM91]